MERELLVERTRAVFGADPFLDVTLLDGVGVAGRTHARRAGCGAAAGPIRRPQTTDDARED
jgi:hypothetical protein